MKSLTPNYLNDLSFSTEQLSTLRALGEYRGKQALYAQQTPETLKSLRTIAVIESVESSNRIEGVTAPRARLQAVVLKTSQPVGRSEQEIAGYRDALELIHNSAEHMPFSANIIKQTHNLLYRYLPQDGGTYKATQNDIVEREPDGTISRVRFRPSSPVETPQQMDTLVSLHGDAINHLNLEPLVVIPLTILDFLCIHPFPDGNGRTARLLTLLLLYHFDYQVGRYISLERFFEQSKASYYETLETSSQGWHDDQHDPYPWMTYFWGVLLAAYREFEERVGEVRGDHGSKTDMVRAAVKRRLVPFAISDIERELPTISRDMIRVVLRQLRDEGVIESVGKGRGAKWKHIDA